MRKSLVSAVLAGAFALTGLVGVAEVGAAPNENANCVAEAFGTAARADGRAFGQLISTAAQELGGIGQIVGPAASSDCGA